MAPDPAEGVELEPGESFVRSWPAEPVRPDGTTERVGWLVLTSKRVGFFRRAGWFGGGPEPHPEFIRPLEQVRIAPAQYWMKIGYGDRVELGGIRLDDRGFRLNRATPAATVTEEIERWKARRRSESEGSTG